MVEGKCIKVRMAEGWQVEEQWDGGTVEAKRVINPHTHDSSYYVPSDSHYQKAQIKSFALHCTIYSSQAAVVGSSVSVL